ncbi:MarR family transcriptional regulator [Aureimonas sp. Leaf454]|uniref:MarR family winged helix-turn-helix transcriptional regulator n=1 Tax=Aureimonas sp. Leaf454 TaxID=1736381 RepID=UPI0006F8721E|nr:MarR family transcriptional regulator [Aureimonas sp. Leaf454]KQT47611.1 MarR family transcriptional regulator [Aureimonas sp. Leaf454]
MSGRPLSDHLSHLLLQANRQMTRRLTADGVSVDQWRILKVLSERQGVTMGAIAEELTLNAPTATKLIDRMVQEALVYRGPDPLDRRKVLVFLAEKGTRLLVAQNRQVDEQESSVETTLGNEDSRKLKDMLESFIRQMG